VRISSLTFILLTSTKWWTPASASKWQIGFNSAFKGLRVDKGRYHQLDSRPLDSIFVMCYSFFISFFLSLVFSYLLIVGVVVVAPDHTQWHARARARAHTHTHTRSVELLWRRDRTVAEISGYELAASERPQTHVLDRQTTRIGTWLS
jgi:hypothetical protein